MISHRGCSLVTLNFHSSVDDSSGYTMCNQKQESPFWGEKGLFHPECQWPEDEVETVKAASRGELGQEINEVQLLSTGRVVLPNQLDIVIISLISGKHAFFSKPP